MKTMFEHLLLISDAEVNEIGQAVDDMLYYAGGGDPDYGHG